MKKIKGKSTPIYVVKKNASKVFGIRRKLKFSYRHKIHYLID